MSNTPTLPDQPEIPTSPRGKRTPSTNTSGLTGWALLLDRIADKFFAPSFLAFLLVATTLVSVIILISGTVELDRMLKGWAFVGPLVGGYVGYAFTKPK